MGPRLVHEFKLFCGNWKRVYLKAIILATTYFGEFSDCMSVKNLTKIAKMILKVVKIAKVSSR